MVSPRDIARRFVSPRAAIGTLALLLLIGGGILLRSQVEKIRIGQKVDRLLESGRPGEVSPTKRRTAMQDLGAKAVPHLIRRLETKPTWIEIQYAKHSRKLPRWANQWLSRRFGIKVGSTTLRVGTNQWTSQAHVFRQLAAIDALGSLGLAARPAIPKLTELASVKNPFSAPESALAAIVGILRDAPGLESYMATELANRDRGGSSVLSIVAIVCARDGAVRREIIKRLIESDPRARSDTLFQLQRLNPTPVELSEDLWTWALQEWQTWSEVAETNKTSMAARYTLLPPLVQMFARTDTNGTFLVQRWWALISDLNPKLRLVGTRMILSSRLRCPPIVPLWKKVWTDTDPSIQQEIAKSLEIQLVFNYLSGTPELIDGLPIFLRHQDPTIRWSALQKVAELGAKAKSSLPACRELVRTETNDRVLAMAITVLAGFGPADYDLASRYRELTNHPVVYVSEAAQKALQKIPMRSESVSPPNE